MKIIDTINRFLQDEKTGGIILMVCTVVSLWLANSAAGPAYTAFWNLPFAGETVVHWINDGLMTVFFLMIGLELKREILEGQFSHVKKALLPVFAAVGGMLVPAGIFTLFNYGTPAQRGAGIPMATDVAFALAVLLMVGKNVPLSLKLFLLAIAVIDDLLAIIVIAVFYSGGLSVGYLGMALGIFAVLLVCSRLGLKSIFIFIPAGIIMWYCMLHSGIHATISGVLLAIALPYKKGDETSLSARLHHGLHKPVAFFILPLFALANTAITVSGNYWQSMATSNSLGIIGGLVIGKPLGVFLFSFIAVKTGIGALHSDLRWKHVFGVAVLAGIGFTISIFISLLAFDDEVLVNQSKMAVLTASVLAAVLAVVWFIVIGGRGRGRKKALTMELGTSD